ncbi:MAG: hypothetical protein CMJ78_15780 [Planctomycetaceae bacterium]|nr:hypothetical protein [Planctomycetaceae bacterium]
MRYSQIDDFHRDILQKIAPMHSIRLTHRIVILSLLAVLLLPSMASARKIYVNNRRGSDAYDGLTPEPESLQAGPTRTLRRALKIARASDTIIIQNTGYPYYEGMNLTGRNHSGSPNAPFVIDGNGAVLSGERSIPARGWRKLPNDIWQLKPYRKGHYQLSLANKVLPEVDVPTGATKLPDIPEGSWCAWRGSIYLHTDPQEEPTEKPYAFAYEGVGISLYDVRSVVIRNITVQRFRLDGINAHDRCDRVVLNEVNTRENGRSGVSIGGTTLMLIRSSTIEKNRKSSLLIQENAAVEVEESNLDNPPTVIDE